MIQLFETIFFQNVIIASRDAATLSLIVALVLLIAGRRVPVVWQHGLWLLVALRLILPVLPGSPLSWQNLIAAPIVEEIVFPSVSERVRGEPSQITGTFSAESQSARSVNSATQFPLAVSWNSILVRVWLSGMALICGVTWFQCVRFGKRLRQLTISDKCAKRRIVRVLNVLVADGKILQVPDIILTEAVVSPALTGFIRHKILIPPDLASTLTDAELSFVLRHELTHMQRRDIWTNWLLAILQAVHWFNPLVWWAFRRTRIEAERATDERVMQSIGQANATGYGETLIRLLEQTSRSTKTLIPGVVGVAESRRDLEKRISLIGSYNGKRGRLANLGAFSLMIVVAAFGLTQASTEDKQSDRIEFQTHSGLFLTKVLSEGDEIAIPMYVEGEEEHPPFYVSSEPIISAAHVSGAKIEEGDSTLIRFSFNQSGQRKLKVATEEMQGEKLAVILNGKLLSVAVVASPFWESVQVSGNFTGAWAESVVRRVNEELKSLASRKESDSEEQAKAEEKGLLRSQTSDSESTASLLKATLPMVEFRDKPLRAVLKLLESNFPEAGPQFVVDEKVDQSSEITLALTNVPVAEVLRFSTSLASAEYRIDGNSIFISPTSDKPAGEEKAVRSKSRATKNSRGFPFDYSPPRLKGIVSDYLIHEFSVKNESVTEAIDQLTQLSKEIDEYGKGVEIIVSEQVDQERLLEFTLRGVSIYTTTDHIAKELGAVTRIRDGKVRVEPEEDPNAPLLVHTWKVASDKFGGEDPKEVLASAGIEFPVGSAVTFVEDENQLIVRLTKANCDKVEAWLRETDRAPGGKP